MCRKTYEYSKIRLNSALEEELKTRVYVCNSCDVEVSFNEEIFFPIESININL